MTVQSSAPATAAAPAPTRPAPAAPTGAPTGLPSDPSTIGRIGDNPLRADAGLKVSGRYAYSSDMWTDDMVWGVTLRSPHPFARIRSIDTGDALAVPGVLAVLTHEDIPGTNLYGLEMSDQPVLAENVVRYQGEPVALVAADHPEIARQAAKKIRVAYDVWEPVTDARSALGHPRWNQVHEGSPYPSNLSRSGAAVHPDGNLVRHVRLRRGDEDARADVVVEGEYVVGMQDQAFLGPESGLAFPDDQGGVDLYVATQWLHVDQRQICAALGLPPEQVRLTLAGVGGAFGGREDLSMHVHACLLALRTGKPVKMVYNREESFFGHVHRHPATMYFQHGATREGRLVFVKAELYFDGGAYASSTPAVVGNAGTMGIGPYDVPNVVMDAYGAYTNNPPCGAMRGFGSVQAAFGYERQMDKLAEKLGMHPVDVRILNALEEGMPIPTGQVIDSPAPVAELVQRLKDLPLPPARADHGGHPDLRDLPGGVGNTTHGEGVKRGVGYAVAYKNVAFSEGYDDLSHARVRLELVGDVPTVTVHTAAAEVGQGLITVEAQICRSELGVDNVISHAKDTAVGSGGSTSASRQTYVTGGAVQHSCEQVRERVLTLAEAVVGHPIVNGRLADGRVLGDGVDLGLAEVLGEQVIDEHHEWRHRRTEEIDPVTGQGFAHVQYTFAAHRAVVDVDVELGLARVVELACAQDVGRAMNPLALEGQLEGGSVQGLGLALTEELLVDGGVVQTTSFGEYRIPTIVDAPALPTVILELGDPETPYGLKGAGELPAISSTPAVLAALRAATGAALTRVPARPEELVV
ncbi:MAG: xanthine dehydrogenase family protein molybdopterin-binding subunit [Geodermatophilaceae bacterium]